MQGLGYGFTMPLYGIAHLLTSKTTGKFCQGFAEALKITNLQFLEDLPVALIVGYFLPTILMAFPLPSNSVHQWLAGLWQGFPVWVLLVQWILSHVRKFWGKTLLPGSRIENRHLLHGAYMFAFSSTCITHVCTLATITARRFFPSMFSPLAQETLTFSKVFIPPYFRDPGPMESMASGIHNFFQYDQYIGSTAALAWAAAISLASKKDGLVLSEWVWLVKELVGVGVIAGPAGALVALMCNRDERLLSGDGLCDKEDGSH